MKSFLSLVTGKHFLSHRLTMRTIVFLGNINFTVAGAPVLLGRPSIGMANDFRQGIKYKCNAVAVRGNIRMENTTGFCVLQCTACGIRNRIFHFQPQDGAGDPTHTYPFLRRD